MAESFWTKVAASVIKATAQGLEKGLESLEVDARKGIDAVKGRLKVAQQVAELAASDEPLDDTPSSKICENCGQDNGKHAPKCLSGQY